MAGIIQEQHPDRCRLFMQWKNMDWPILVDSLNLLDVAVVPLTVLIDEGGVVQAIQPKKEQFQDFLAAEYQGSQAAPTDRSASRAGGPLDRLLEGGPDQIDRAVSELEDLLEKEPDNGRTHFRLGVAYRMRYDSPRRREGDFARAVRSWGKALEIDPNQYIWRRRIQQYGPRLSKPYPFYDWVSRARTEIEKRGDRPVQLLVEPGGAEFAKPARTFIAADQKTEPDPGGRIRRDSKGLIKTESTLVPGRLRSGQSGRVHIVFRPDRAQKAHWNNEAEDLVFWVAPPQGWQVDRRLQSIARPSQEVSEEARTIEFEVQPPANFSGPQRLSGYALYYVCEDVNGVCLYRRQDVEVRIEVLAKP